VDRPGDGPAVQVARKGRRCDVSETSKQATEAQAEQKPAKAPYVRTQVKTRNPKPGVYTTLDGNWEIERVDGSKKWSVFQVATDEAGKPTGERDLARKDAGTWDEALNVVRELSPRSLEELNTPPAKPAAPAKAKADPTPEAKEQGTSERRSGATGPAPRKTRGPGETIHTRKTRAAKVG
jgi:hypothetical protein